MRRRWLETRVESGEEEEWRVVLVYEEGDNSATAMVAETKNSSVRERDFWREKGGGGRKSGEGVDLGRERVKGERERW